MGEGGTILTSFIRQRIPPTFLPMGERTLATPAHLHPLPPGPMRTLVLQDQAACAVFVLWSQQRWEEGVQLHLQGAGPSPVHGGGSHPQDVFKWSCYGNSDSLLCRQRLLKSCSVRGSDVPVGCLPARGGGAFGPTHVTSAVGFTWLQRLGWSCWGSWEQRASQLCLRPVAPMLSSL